MALLTGELSAYNHLDQLTGVTSKLLLAVKAKNAKECVHAHKQKFVANKRNMH